MKRWWIAGVAGVRAARAIGQAEAARPDAARAATARTGTIGQGTGVRAATRGAVVSSAGVRMARAGGFGAAAVLALLVACAGDPAPPDAAIGPAPAPSADPAAMGVLAGSARAIDGDSLWLGGTQIRLNGVDAPEWNQRCAAAGGGHWACGAAASGRLAALVSAGPVRCAQTDRDRFGRVVADCTTADDVDLGGTLVAEGLAWAYARHDARHVPAEARARAEGRGVWQAPTATAAALRAGAAAPGPAPTASPLPASSASAAAGACPIKGNISAGGARIYHLPGTRFYAQTGIDPARGERWFCSETEAIAAGWRASAAG